MVREVQVGGPVFRPNPESGVWFCAVTQASLLKASNTWAGGPEG